MAVTARGTFSGVAVTVTPPHVKVTHPPSLLTTEFYVEITASGHSRVKIVMNILVIQYGDSAVAAPEEDYNTVTHLHIEHIFIQIQMTTIYHQGAETYLIKFIQLAVNVT